MERVFNTPVVPNRVDEHDTIMRMSLRPPVWHDGTERPIHRRKPRGAGNSPRLRKRPRLAHGHNRASNDLSPTEHGIGVIRLLQADSAG